MEMNEDKRSPALMDLPQKFGKVFNASVWGMSAPWTLVVSALIGIGLMVLPAWAGVPNKDTFADINHLSGALIVVVTVICMGEVVRAGRFVNVLIGLALAILPWIMVDGHSAWKIIDLIAGIVIIALSVPRGLKKERYGLWDAYVV